MIKPLRFWVPGTPAPKGSHKGFVRGGRVVVVNDTPATAKWEKTVAVTARYAMAGRTMIPPEGCVVLKAVFALESPAYRYGTGRNADQLKLDARRAPCVKPDVDKLLRSTLDGLNGIVFADDAQVVISACGKIYAPKGQPTGAVLEVAGFSHAEQRDFTDFYFDTVWSSQPGLRPRAGQLEIGYAQE